MAQLAHVDRLTALVENAVGEHPAPADEPVIHRVSHEQIMATPPIEWLVDDLLPRSGVSIISGAPKSGKSTLARCLVATLAQGGGTFLGRRANKGKVLYVALDEHPAMIKGHMEVLENGGGCDLSGVEYILAPINADDLSSIVDDDDLVVIDTLGQMTAGMVEDSNEYLGWQEVMRTIRDAANETRAHMCLIHHARKAGGDRAAGVLGSVAIVGAVDSVIEINMVEDVATGSWRRTVSSTQRAGRDLGKLTIVLEEDGWVAPFNVPQPPTTREEIISLAQFYGDEGITQDIACQKIEGRHERTRTIFKVLQAEGHLVKRGARWTLPETREINL